MKGIKRQYVLGHFGSLADDSIASFTNPSKFFTQLGQADKYFWPALHVQKTEQGWDLSTELLSDFSGCEVCILYTIIASA